MSANRADFRGYKNPMFGKRSANARYVMCEYQIFKSGTEAARVLYVSPTTIRDRILNNKPGYLYIT